jgi:hypothetical protein
VYTAQMNVSERTTMKALAQASMDWRVMAAGF